MHMLLYRLKMRAACSCPQKRPEGRLNTIPKAPGCSNLALYMRTTGHVIDIMDCKIACGAQAGNEGCVRLSTDFFPEGVLNPIPRNTHSFGGFPSLSDKGSSGLMGLNALRNSTGVARL